MFDLNDIQGPAMTDEPLAFLAEAFGGALEPGLERELARRDDEASPGLRLPGALVVASARGAGMPVHRL